MDIPEIKFDPLNWDEFDKFCMNNNVIWRAASYESHVRHIDDEIQKLHLLAMFLVKENVELRKLFVEMLNRPR